MLVHLKWIIQKQWDRSDELAMSICKTQQAKHKSIFSAIDIKRFWFWNTYKKLPFWYQGKWFIPMCYLPDSKFWSTCNTITFYFVRYCSGLHTISSDKLLLSGFCFSKKRWKFTVHDCTYIQSKNIQDRGNTCSLNCKVIKMWLRF